MKSSFCADNKLFKGENIIQRGGNFFKLQITFIHNFINNFQVQT